MITEPLEHVIKVPADYCDSLSVIVEGRTAIRIDVDGWQSPRIHAGDIEALIDALKEAHNGIPGLAR